MTKVSSNKANNSKTISVRVPMETYLNLLDNCQECKLSLSEYVIHKVFNKDKISLENKGKEKEITKLKSQISKVNEELKKANYEKAALGNQKASAKKSMKTKETEFDKLKNTNRVLKAEAVDLKSRLTKANKHLEKIYSEALNNKHSQVILTKSKLKTF